MIGFNKHLIHVGSNIEQLRGVLASTDSELADLERKVTTLQYRKLIPAPVDRPSASAWLNKRTWMTCQKYQPSTSMTHVTCKQSLVQF